MKEYFQRFGKVLKPYHLLYGIFFLLFIVGIIYRLLKQS